MKAESNPERAGLRCRRRSATISKASDNAARQKPNMPSPFPGMDPYLEDPAFWPDFHHTIITCWREIVADVLPDTYDARIGKRVNLTPLEPEVVKLISPDVSVSQKPGAKKTCSPGEAVAVLEPEIIPQSYVEQVHESYIEILH